MTLRKSKTGRLPPPPAAPLRVVHPEAAGIDVHREPHGVAIPPDHDLDPVRTFGACTCDLEALADWLQHCLYRPGTSRASHVLDASLHAVPRSSWTPADPRGSHPRDPSV